MALQDYRLQWLIQQEAKLSQRGRAMLRLVENLAVTQGRSRSFEITPLSIIIIILLLLL